MAVSSGRADDLSCNWGTLDVFDCSFEIYLNLLKFEDPSMYRSLKDTDGRMVEET